MFHNYKFDPKDPSEKHSFEINDLDISIVNGIRRTILTDIPVVGFIGEDDITVDMIVNTGPLHNEILIHRIGLVPLHLTEEETENYEDNDMVFELNYKNDGNTIQNIETDKMSGKNKDKDLTKQELTRIFPANKVTKNHILITKLRTNEHIHFIANAVKKTARFNASFSPVSLCNFFYIQDPKKAEKTTNLLDKERAFYKNKYGDASKFQFEIEPINSFHPKYLINKAIEIIIDKLNKLRNNITKENLDNDVTITLFNESTYDFNINNEDDTLGNIIQSLVHNKYIREKKSAINDIYCTYVGYICPHPLKNLLKIRITLEGQNNKLLFIQFLEENCKTIIEHLMEIKSEWNKFILNK